jgi:hypothetical protein
MQLLHRERTITTEFSKFSGVEYAAGVLINKRKQPKLTAQWHQIDGKLVCKWSEP